MDIDYKHSLKLKKHHHRSSSAEDDEEDEDEDEEEEEEFSKDKKKKNEFNGNNEAKISKRDKIKKEETAQERGEAKGLGSCSSRSVN